MKEQDKSPRVTGIGGVFFKCKDPQKAREWYRDHLGFNIDAYGSSFEWRQAADPELKGYTQWSPFPHDTQYFTPSEKAFMVNYRVNDIGAMVAKLKSEGVSVVDEIESYEYGKFVHIMDGEGNKIELWEPVDEAFEKIAEAVTK